MEFIARVFIETAATMVLLACVNSVNLPSADLIVSALPNLESLDSSLDAPAIPVTYYREFDSPMVCF